MSNRVAVFLAYLALAAVVLGWVWLMAAPTSA